jgi:hypothetical protein
MPKYPNSGSHKEAVRIIDFSTQLFGSKSTQVSRKDVLITVCPRTRLNCCWQRSLKNRDFHKH